MWDGLWYLPRKVRGLSASHVAFPFLLKIDPNTLYIIQKFRSLVAAARTPSLLALIPHLPSQGLGPKEQWPGLGGCPPILLALETASRGCGLFLGAPPPPPPHGQGQILESASSVPSKLPSGVKCKPLGCSDGLPGPGTRVFFFPSAPPTSPHPMNPGSCKWGVGNVTLKRLWYLRRLRSAFHSTLSLFSPAILWPRISQRQDSRLVLCSLAEVEQTRLPPRGSSLPASPPRQPLGFRDLGGDKAPRPSVSPVSASP